MRIHITIAKIQRTIAHEEYLKYLPSIKSRADNVMKIWEQRNDADAVNSIIVIRCYVISYNITVKCSCTIGGRRYIFRFIL